MSHLTFLLTNGNKKLEPERWAALFGITILDADGWRGHDFNEECDILTFVNRVASCTINPLK